MVFFFEKKHPRKLKKVKLADLARDVLLSGHFINTNSAKCVHDTQSLHISFHIWFTNWLIKQLIYNKYVSLIYVDLISLNECMEVYLTLQSNIILLSLNELCLTCSADQVQVAISWGFMIWDLISFITNYRFFPIKFLEINNINIKLIW